MLCGIDEERSGPFVGSVGVAGVVLIDEIT